MNDQDRMVAPEPVAGERDTADVGIRPQTGLFHVAVAHVYVLKRALQSPEEGPHVSGSAQVGFRNHFHERCTRAIEVDRG